MPNGAPRLSCRRTSESTMSLSKQVQTGSRRDMPCSTTPRRNVWITSLCLLRTNLNSSNYINWAVDTKNPSSELVTSLIKIFDLCSLSRGHRDLRKRPEVNFGCRLRPLGWEIDSRRSWGGRIKVEQDERRILMTAAARRHAIFAAIGWCSKCKHWSFFLFFHGSTSRASSFQVRCVPGQWLTLRLAPSTGNFEFRVDRDHIR